MFRSTVARSSAVAVTASRALSTSSPTTLLVRRSQAVAAAVTPVRRLAPLFAHPIAVRWYSAGGGLNKEEIEGRIVSLLKGFDKVSDTSSIKGTSHFANDLGLDSLDTVEVVMAIEEEFSIEIPDKDADTIHSVDKAVEYILHQPDAH